MKLKKYIPTFLKYPLITIYVLYRCITRGTQAKEIKLNLAGVLPNSKSKIIVHGGKVKLLALREYFGDSWKNFNIAYFVSSGLPFAPSLWIRIYKLFGIKIVWNQNGFAYPAWAGLNTNRINLLMEPLQAADYVVFQTEFTKRCTDKFLGGYKGQFSILINPVDTKVFKPSEDLLPVDPLMVLMSGHHFESEERLRVSLESIRILRQRGHNVRLVVIGNTQKLPEENWIDVLGRFTQSEAPNLYKKGHLLLHLKSLDPCPTFVLEAIASGLPVVALENGGLPEMLDSNSGILIPSKEDFEVFHYPSPDAVADAILKVKDNLIEFSRGARERALLFDKELWLKKHEGIFNQLLK